MITIEYTNDVLEGEPGPNLYWRGNPVDFLALICHLHSLGSKEGIEIRLETIPLVRIIGAFSITARSSSEGSILCKMDVNTIFIDLTSSLWRQVLVKFLQISFFPSHDYIEFPDLQLFENANFIVSSEVHDPGNSCLDTDA
ncbi:MAG: hypothetical protein AAGU11_07005 [Syntrophobacteraceae bacterium]